MAVPALRQELLRMHDLVRSTARTVVDRPGGAVGSVGAHADAIFRLGRSVRSFAVTVRMEGMSRNLAETIPRQLRISRYMEEAATLLSEIQMIDHSGKHQSGQVTKPEVEALLDAAREALLACEVQAPEPGWREGLVAQRNSFEKAYQQTKTAVLQAAASHRISIEDADRLLDAGSAVRRMMDQFFKATFMLNDQTERSGEDDGPHLNPSGDGRSIPQH